MDHMMIMRAVDHIHSHGGSVTELVSLCGGLPDPVAADNPLRYKFSWSPRGTVSYLFLDSQSPTLRCDDSSL
jgi:saccharopine dehydrogenase-like NADP-dependent oxidoreductase